MATTKQCPVCEGDGRIITALEIGNRLLTDSEACEACAGTGCVQPHTCGAGPHGDEPCSACYAEMAAAEARGSTDTTIIDRLRQRVDRLMESARIVSNSGKPESDNEFGRDATLLHNAAGALTAAPAPAEPTR